MSNTTTTNLLKTLEFALRFFALLLTKKELNIFLKKLGENIALVRQKKGITQIDLSYEIDTDRANISRLEAGKTNPRTSTLLKISKALSVDVRDLLDF